MHEPVEGLSIDAALYELAAVEERQVIDVWRNIPPTAKKYRWKSMAATVNGNAQPARPQGLTVEIRDVETASAAAVRCWQGIVPRLVQGLLHGDWVLTFRTRQANLARGKVSKDDWHGLSFRITGPDGHAEIVRARGVARPAWLERSGHVYFSFLFQRIKPESVARLPRSYEPKGFTVDQEREAQAHFLTLLASLASAEQRQAVGLPEWERRVRVKFPTMSGEAWRRMKKVATGDGKFPEIARRGAKKRAAASLTDDVQGN